MYLHRASLANNWGLCQTSYSCNNSHVFIVVVVVFFRGNLDDFAPAYRHQHILSANPLLICGTMLSIRSALKGWSCSEKESLYWPHLHEVHTSGHWDNSRRISINTHAWYETKLMVKIPMVFPLSLLVNTEGILSPRNLALGHISASPVELCKAWFVYNLARGYENDSWC